MLSKIHMLLFRQAHAEHQVVNMCNGNVYAYNIEVVMFMRTSKYPSTQWHLMYC